MVFHHCAWYIQDVTFNWCSSKSSNCFFGNYWFELSNWCHPPPPPKKKKKSVRQYSKCQNLLIDWELEFLGGTSSDPQIVFKHVNFRGAPVKLNTLYVLLAGGKSIWSMVSPPLWRMFIGTVCLATRAVP